MNRKKTIIFTVSLVLVAVIVSVFVWGNFFLSKKDMPADSKPFGFEALKFNGSYVSTNIFAEERNKFFNKWKRDAEMARRSDEERNDLLLDQIIERLVLEDYIYKKSGISVSDSEADDYINKYIKKKYADSGELAMFMNSQGYFNEEAMKKGIKDYILRHKCFYKSAKEYNVTLTDKEIEEGYTRHKMENRRVDLKHIFISNTNRSKEEALALAKDIHAKIKSKEGDFETLAKEYSEDEETKNNGGVISGLTLGFHEPSFDDSVFNAQPGQLLDPIEVLRGYEIVYVEKATEFYRTQDEFTKIILVDKFLKSDKYKEWIEKLKKDNEIEITDPLMKAYRLFRDKEYNEAAKLYEKAYADKKDIFYLERASDSYKLAGNWEDLVRISKSGVKESPSDIKFHLNQAEGLYKTGSKDEALRVLKEAEELSKDSIYHLDIIQKMYEGWGFKDDSERLKKHLKDKGL
ncbi:MAG: peptidylprolyl isomerase [Bacillota bacterium]